MTAAICLSLIVGVGIGFALALWLGMEVERRQQKDATDDELPATVNSDLPYFYYRITAVRADDGPQAEYMTVDAPGREPSPN